MSTFTIDFFELMFLCEACIPHVPIARAMFFQDMTEKHYHSMTDAERKKAFEWITTKDRFSLENEDCQVFFARYNPNNQYLVYTEFEGKKEVKMCFKFNDKYHVNTSTSVAEQYIWKIEKIEPK